MANDGKEKLGSQRGGTVKTGSLVLDQSVVLGCMLAITFFAWLYILSMALNLFDMTDAVMSGMDDMTGQALVMASVPWSLSELLIAAGTWIVMMAGMMLPSAIPMILGFADQSERVGGSCLATLAFVFGYIVVWTGFAIAAVGMQWALSRLGLLHPQTKAAVGIWGAGIFIAAGIYEWSTLKAVCLAWCQNPRAFIASQWRPGPSGALRIGFAHGTYCLGCCWVLMLLLFAVGVMNLVWVVGLSLLILAQKLLPSGERLARVAGVVMVAAGIYLLAQGMS